MRLLCFLLFIGICPSSHAQEFYQSYFDDFSGLGRDDAIAFAIEGWTYTGTGNHGGFSQSNRFYRIDPFTHASMEVAEFPGVPRQYSCAMDCHGYGYVISGYSSSGQPLSEVWRYDPINSTWEQMTDFPGDGRWAASLIKIRDQLYFGTGRDTSQSFNDFWRYDTETDKWTEVASLPIIPRHETVGFTLYDKGYIGLGRDSSGILQKDFYCYDPDKNDWSKVADLPTGPRYYSVATQFYGNGFVVGGQDSSGTVFGDVWIYQPITDEWAEMPELAIYPTRGMAACNNGRELDFLFGLTQDFERTNRIWVVNGPISLQSAESYHYEMFYNADRKTVYFKHIISGEHISIFDLTGRLVETLTPTDDSFSYDCTGLSAGVYVARQLAYTLRWVNE